MKFYGANFLWPVSPFVLLTFSTICPLFRIKFKTFDSLISIITAVVYVKSHNYFVHKFVLRE